MCSKNLLRFFLSAVLVLTNSSCGLHTGEKSPQAPPPSYSGNGFNCIGQIPSHIEDYVFDRLAGEQVTEFVVCLQKAFVAFAQYTRGRDSTTYAPDEIRRFLETYFIKDKHVSDELLHEFMVIKRAFVGGEIDRISRGELYVAVEVLEDLRKEAIRLKPHLKALNPVLAKRQPPEQVGQNIREAYAALNESIAVISKRFQANAHDYPLANMRSFMEEFRAFTGWAEHFPQATPVANWVEFLRIFKELTVSPDDSDKVRPRDWVPLMQSLSRWYLTYLEFEVGVREQPKLHGVGLQNTLHLAESIFPLLEDSISRQKNMTITVEQMMAMARALKSVKWAPDAWRVESMQGALKAITGRIFGDPGVDLEQRTSGGMSMRTLARMKDSFYQWAYVQMNLDSEMGGRATIDSIQVPNLQPEKEMLAVSDPRPRDLSNPDWLDFLKVRGLMRPLFPPDSQSIVVAPVSKLTSLGVEHGFYNLSIMNLLRSLVGLIYKGYSSDARGRVTWQSGLKSSEMEKFYDDFRDIGIDLGFVDPRNLKTGSRVFIEGNLFTYSSDGLMPEATDIRGKMSFVETMELLAFLFSGGNLAGKIYDTLKVECANGPLDLGGKPKLDRPCVEIKLARVIDQTFTNLPNMKNYFAHLLPIERQSYVQNLLATAKNPVSSDDLWVEMSEFSTVAVVSHYAETVMTRFDLNESGTLTNEEIDEATNLFRGFIQWLAAEKMGKVLSDADAGAVFYYILANKELPEGFWASVSVGWTTWFGAGEVTLTRYDLSVVFKVIISKLTEQQPQPDPIPSDCRGIRDALMRPECEGMQQTGPDGKPL